MRLLLLIVSLGVSGQAFTTRPNPILKRSLRLWESNNSDGDDGLEEKLFRIAKSLKLEIFDLDEGIFGLDSKDISYGLEVLQAEIKVEPSLGLDLVEMASSGGMDGRGLVLVGGVSGNAADTPIQVGDVIVGVTGGTTFVERTAGSDYDVTVSAIGQAKQAALQQNQNFIRMEINRLVERAKIKVKVEQPQEGTNEIKVMEIDALAGENLRRLMLRKGLKIYDRKTKRFDMPYATGDCGGEGLCGTCLVAVKQGYDLLNEKDNLETFITKGRPVSWRASCRTVVGADNKGGELRIAISPQSNFEDEINPGVKSVL